jgi:hypothetical protein
MATCPNEYYANPNSGVPLCSACDATCLWCDGGTNTDCTKCQENTRYLHNK